MTANPTVADLLVSAKSTPEKVTLELRLLPFRADPYAEFVRLVERSIQYSIQVMVKDKNVIQGLSEDQLTSFLLGPLKGMAFDATHDTNTGGHCDIVINGPDEMLWLGEAKIFTSAYGKLLGGFRQLTDRYATGAVNQSHGGMIIYSYAEKVADMMANWRDYVVEAEGIAAEKIDDSPLEFKTTKLHQATQLPIIVRHFPVPLFHQPTDTQPAPKRSTGKRT